MDDWHRAITFIRARDERGAAEVVPYRWGRALINRRLNLVHDANYPRSEGEVAQLETVETLPEFRQRGFARAMLSAALAAAADYGVIFLVADADDWPQHFYQRLGFDPVGFESRFLRLLDG